MAADLLYDSREDLPPHLGRSTELLVNELDRFETLLSDLLEISRYDAGMAELSAEKIDIRGLIASCIAASQPLAVNAGVTIVRQLPPRAVTAEVDSRRVERILRNLLNNAIDHAEGGTIDLELAADDQVLAITVTDHGVGLKPGEAGLVFNRFWRADPSRQRQTGGTGLGLAISLEDARLHGGWLQASGAPGHGARFRLTLPLVAGTLVNSSPLPLRVGGDDVDEPVDGAPDPLDTRDWTHHGLAGALPAGALISWPGVADNTDGGPQ
jgi:two-component system sensor histidine kinase MtrB